MLNHIKSTVIFPASERITNRSVTAKLQILRKHYRETKEVRENKKKSQLFEILSIAKNKVPYYLQEIPFTDKSIIKEDTKRFINTDFQDSNLIRRLTGGSTGPTNDIFYNLDALDWSSAANLFSLEFTGRKHHNTECILSSEPKKNGFKDILNLTAKSFAMNRSVIHVESLDTKDLSQIWKKLKNLKPYLIQGHPSTLYALSKYVQKNNFPIIESLKAFESTGESLDSKKIKSIEENIGCKVYNRFGNAEFGVIAHSREHPFELEILDYLVHAENLSIGNGLEEIILTSLTNKAMPLIRYQTGDFGEIVTKENHDIITNIYGRIHDTVKLNGKTVPTHYIQSFMDEIGGIDEFQIIKNATSRPTLKIVLSDDRQNKKESILKILLLKFTNEFEIVFTDFNGLTRCGWRDKFKYVVDE